MSFITISRWDLEGRSVGGKEGRETTRDCELSALISLYNINVPQAISQTGWKWVGIYKIGFKIKWSVEWYNLLMYLHNLYSLSNGLINIDYDFTYAKQLVFPTKILGLNKKLTAFTLLPVLSSLLFYASPFRIYAVQFVQAPSLYHHHVHRAYLKRCQ